MATPALGPSLGVAPAGTWTWMSLFSNSAGSILSDAAMLLTRLSAACALSRMTSPSWPVSKSLPLPGVRVASMKRMSPPTGGQASRHARHTGAHGALVLEAQRPQDPLQGVDADVLLLGLAFGSLDGDAAQHAADLALQVAHARLARVALDDAPERCILDLDLLG